MEFAMTHLLHALILLPHCKVQKVTSGHHFRNFHNLQYSLPQEFIYKKSNGNNLVLA